MQYRPGVFEELKDEFIKKLDVSTKISDDEVLEQIDDVIVRYGKRKYISMEEKTKLRLELFNSMRKLDVLQELIEAPDITEIMVNGTDNIFYEKGGRIYKWDKRISSVEKLNDIIQQIVAKANRIVNEASSIVDTRLEDGSRVNIVLNPVAINGPIITIRKFPKNPMTIEDLIEIGSVSKEAAVFLEKIVRARYNIFISGGTGSGKTTFLNILSNFIPCEERILSIEDSAELQINSIPNLVRLETRNANTEGENAITIRDLIKTALRMRPDRIIVGEIRGNEAIDMLQAMNTGHDGSISTGHGNSPMDMLSRIETMVLMGMEIPLEAVQRQIVSGIDILVHLGRLRDKSRRVLEINEIEDIKDGKYILNTLFKFNETGESNGSVKGELVKVGDMRNDVKLLVSGQGVIF